MKKQVEPQYDQHPGLEWAKSVIDSIEPRTGRSLTAWLDLLAKQNLPDEKSRVAWLRAEHKLGIPTAKAIALSAAGESLLAYEPTNYVEQMYAGKKSALRPIYDALLELGKSLGPDVTVTPTSTTVPLRRRFVFANIKPTTNTRVDLGLALRDTAVSGRLMDTGGFAKGDRITHRIGITSPAEIDKEVRMWLKRAYDLDAK